MITFGIELLIIKVSTECFNQIRGKAKDDVWRWGLFDGAYSLVSRGDKQN